MVLSELLKAIQPIQIIGSTETEITGVNIDSRLVQAGHLFMAMRGTQTDGHVYIPAAIEKGASPCSAKMYPKLNRRAHLHSSERQRRRCRQSSHYILRRSYFQDGTSRRNRNEWENDHRHLII